MPSTPAPSGPQAVLLDRTFDRTLHAWVQRFSHPHWHGRHVEGWLFEGRAQRQEAERQLAQAGVHARLHSAYKPLLHHFLEDVDTARLATARIRYPRTQAGPARRFLLEAYPLAALPLAEPPRFEPREDAQPYYDVELLWRDGQRTQQRVFAPNGMHADVLGAATLSPTGWLRAGTRAGAADLLDTPVHTDAEQAFEHALQAVLGHPWPAQEPYFERLQIQVDLPGFEHHLAWAGESVSLPEAVHEDLYFSLLEWFQRHSGRPPGDRRLQPGQIVPDVRGGAGAPRVRVALQRFDAASQDAQAAPAWHAATDGQPLDTLDTAPPPARIHRHLQDGGGEPFSADTRQGRTVWGRYHRGTQAPVFLSAGQHANETSGVVGALRAAQALLTRPGTHLALIALENPDGYALHRELCAVHPGHMHHAARYTALGDDVEYRDAPPFFEREARQAALALSGAPLHVNLHGYPAHEWTRPLSGYVPRGFEQWMLPKGFFLILRHHAGWERPARALLESVCAALRQVPGLAEYNARQRALYERHAGPLPFEVIDGIACMQSENRHDAPVTLITEFPDETVHGEAFRFAHTVQMHTALAAYEAWQRISPAWPRS